MVTSKRDRQLQAERQAKDANKSTPTVGSTSRTRRLVIGGVALALAVLMIGSTLGAIFIGGGATP